MASERKKLRILEVASGLPRWGGTEIHLLQLSERLVQKGHSVTVVCISGSFVEKEALKRNLPVVNARVQHQTDFADAGKWMRILREYKPDVVHVHWAPDYLVPPLMARLARVPAVLLSHHSPHPLKPKPIRLSLWRHGLLDRVVALSESVRQTLIKQLPPERVVTIHHGTDPDVFRKTTRPPQWLRQEWGVPEGAFIVGIVGRLAAEKGIDVFIEALSQVRDPLVYGVVVGDGEERPRLEEQVRRHQLQDRVIFAGFRPDVDNAINALDVLVLASTWAEPCAAVIQQAMSLSKPVIGTDIGGTPEMIVHGETGLLVPPNDAPALAAAIAQLKNSPEAVTKMGHAGAQRVEDKFTFTATVCKVESLYYDVLATKK